MRGGVSQGPPLIPSLPWAIFFVAILLRVLVGFQPHSGQNNHHGSKVAYGGDYEAQRHWMELTWSLPLGDWYYYDLEYWGLDYPPLTAYVSWICGYASSKLLGPQSVALESSRGLEDATHKAFMRSTVLVFDVLVYFTAVWYTTFTRFLIQDFSVSLSLGRKRFWLCCLALAQPALILIDHGHFQYNNVALGLALWSFHFMTLPGFTNCIMGSIFFSLALNFKQMTLYYAPAIFFYLLGRCFDAGNIGSSSVAQQRRLFFARFVSLGATVIMTFALLWWPFLYYQTSSAITASSFSSTELQRFQHVLRRLFPFQRGLFEGKVSNLWCAMSVKPISIRQRIPVQLQPIAATFLTLLLFAPSAYRLFLLGRKRYDTKIDYVENCQLHWRMLLWGAASSGLAFFLASFQVHEKSILMALAPLSLLLYDNEEFVEWFSLVATWTLWPLLVIDRLQVAYACVMVIFLMLSVLRRHQEYDKRQPPESKRAIRLAVILSSSAMLCLHILEIMVEPPRNLPDLFPVLWSVAGCFFFCCSWLVTVWSLWRPSNLQAAEQKKGIHSKTD